MINLKSKEEIKKMRQGGEILASVLSELLQNIKPGVSEIEIDKLAEKLIRSKGAEPGFKKVEGYKYSICVSTNNAVVHGIPTNYKFKNGDIVGIDCGVFFKGFHTDMAETIIVDAEVASENFRVHKAGDLGLKSKKVVSANAHSKNFASSPRQNYDLLITFLQTGKKALGEAIKVAKVGNRVGNISETIQNIIESKGYSVVRSLVGHGVGKKLHEEPEIPGFLTSKVAKTPLLSEGMAIAIEAIYNMGKSDVILSRDDNWTIKTADGSISGLFERTIAITKEGPVILTK
ncbi:MAG: M24 family metallopeptidase [Candidatus Levybacteria bacterium]|nr:M24 family metallopeptidase [Candidatus Levybacteria bacterium]